MDFERILRQLYFIVILSTSYCEPGLDPITFTFNENSNYCWYSLHEVLNKAKHCWVMSTNFLFSTVCWHFPAMFCLYTSSKFFHTHNLNFHWRWRWWDQIQAIFLNLFYFKANIIWDFNTKRGAYFWKSLGFWLDSYYFDDIFWTVRLLRLVFY